MEEPETKSVVRERVEGDCILSKYAETKDSHAFVSWKGICKRAHHRIKFEEYYGRKIKEGHVLHHKCRVKSCINPIHLEEREWGEHSSYHNRGENNVNVVLQEKDVLYIRSLYKLGGISYMGIAKKYGVSKGCVMAILTRRSWAYLEEENNVEG